MYYDPEYKIAFYFVPKNANTTTKQMLLESRNDPEITAAINSGKLLIHRAIDTRRNKAEFIAYPQAKYRITVVRDPVQRFASAYQDKIIGQGWAEPTLPVSEFIRDFDQYMKIRRLENHFEPQYLYLGEDPAYYTHIFRTDELEQLAELFGHIYGRKPTIPVANKTTKIIKLYPEAIDWIRNVLAKKDYELGYC